MTDSKFIEGKEKVMYNTKKITMTVVENPTVERRTFKKQNTLLSSISKRYIL